MLIPTFQQGSVEVSWKTTTNGSLPALAGVCARHFPCTISLIPLRRPSHFKAKEGLEVWLQEVELLPGKKEALNSNPSTEEKKQNKKKGS
jgi:hypothetical protein